MADAGDDLDRIRRAIAELDDRQQQATAEIAELRAQLAGLVDLLVARQTLNPGHRKHLSTLRERAPAKLLQIRLSSHRDKREVPPLAEPLDCAALFPICRARCCMFQVELSAEDLEEGKLRWDHQHPYLLRKELDGYCTYLDRSTGGCTAYEHRPAPCRIYDCRKDERIWVDFEKKIPAPLPFSGDFSL